MVSAIMHTLPRFVAVVISGLVAIVDVSGGAHLGGRAHADPVSTLWHLAPVDGVGTTAGTATPAPAATVEPLLGDVAGPAREVTLPDLLAQAVAYSPALAQARLNRDLASEAIARAQTWKDWTVQADGTIARQRGQNSVGLSGDLGRRLATGGTIGLHADAGWQTVTTATGDANLYTDAITATLVQPLMRGKGEDLILAVERGARHDRDAAVLAERAAAITAVRDVILDYFDLVAAENNLAIQRSSLDLARERLRVTEAGIKAGGVAESETIAVEQAIATREDGAMSSELAVISQSLALRRLVGLPIGPGEIALATKIDLAVPARTWDSSALVAEALATSPELARLAALEAGATIDIEVTENGVLPSLDLGLTFGPSGSADDPATSAWNMIKFDEVTALGSLTYRTTLGERAAKIDARSSRLRRETIRVTAVDVKAQIVQAMTVAVAQVTTAERRFGIAARAVTLAEKNLAVEQARLTLGRSRNVDVLTRQDELRAAQLRASQAVIDWHRAATAIGALTGELLPTYGVVLRDPAP